MSKRLIFLLITLVIFCIVIFQFFYYVDIPNKCAVAIVPSAEFSNRNIIRSIKVLKKALPFEYTKLCDNVRKINTNIGCGGFDGGCYYEGGKNTIYVSSNQRDLVTTVEVLVHETCHLLQEKEGRKIEEFECYQKGDNALKELVNY